MSRNTQRDAQTHIKRLNSEKLIFPVNIFRTPDKLFNSVKNAESHDVKNWPDSLSGSKNFDNCVGSTNMRRWFLVKVRLIDFFYSTVILGCFSVWIYLILSEPTQFQPTRTFWRSWYCPSIKFSIEQKSYYFHLKEPNPLISELFLISKSKQDKPFK